MGLRGLLAAALLSLGACAATPPPADSRLQLVDLTDEFAEAWDRTQALEDGARATAFKAHFAPILPGFYTHERHGLPNSERYDGFLLKALKAYPDERAGIEAVSRGFLAMLAPAQASFEAEFGPMTGYPPIYLVHSLGEFDGGTRSLPEGTRLLFGADMIARIHSGRDVRPFFHHELFHLFHNRTFSECDPVWCGLWTEGLAVYVASRLNPGAGDHELLLTFPEPLRAAVERDRAHAVCSVVARLESEDEADSKALFSSGRLDEKLPPRFGYYVGYLAAAEAGKSRSLRQLAALGPAEVRPLVEASLRALATCPA